MGFSVSSLIRNSNKNFGKDIPVCEKIKTEGKYALPKGTLQF